MKKIILKILIICSSILIFTGCGKKQEDLVTEPETEEITENNENPAVEIEQLDGLIENEYEDLEIAATVLERKAILPGSTIPLNITVTNNGNKKIVYTQGSGSFEIPEAIVLNVPKLQTILPQDHLGIATMDFRSGELLPGESLEYTLYLRATTPLETFNDYTYEKWEQGQTYIADLEWAQLSEEYSDITAVEPGTYEGNVYFLYYLEDEKEPNPTLSATGYNRSTFEIGVTD